MLSSTLIIWTKALVTVFMSSISIHLYYLLASTLSIVISVRCVKVGDDHAKLSHWRRRNLKTASL